MRLKSFYLPGIEDNRRCKSIEFDRHSTYRHFTRDKDVPILSTIYDKVKLLEHVSLFCSRCIVRRCNFHQNA
jgi:hypothetical protein